MRGHRFRIGVGIAIFFIVLTYNNCDKVTFTGSTSRLGGIVGNPLNPGQSSSEILYAICSVLNRCQAQVSYNLCVSGIQGTNGIGAQLGLAPGVDNPFSAVETADGEGQIKANPLATGACANTINSLNCANPNVINAYVATNASPFGGVVNMIPAQACDQVYTPPPVGTNLEVPIEVTDYGLSSQTVPVTFSRTTTSLNTANYDGIITYSFEVVATNSDTAPANITLVDSSGLPVSVIPIPKGVTAPTRYRTVFSPTAGSNNYRVQLDGTTGDNLLTASVARILVDQVGATQTSIYVPMVNSYNQPNTVSNADDSTAMVDDAYPGGIYATFEPVHYALWNKNDAAFSQIASGNAFTFEAVISTSTANTSTAYASLFDNTTGNQVTASQVSTTSATPTLVTSSFSDTAANFATSDDMLVKIRNDGGGDDAYIYRAGLWVKLVNLAHAEVYYRYSMAWYASNPTPLQQAPSPMVMLDPSVFSLPTSIYHEAIGYVGTAGTPCTETPYDMGASDFLGSTGAAVSGAALTFNTTSPARLRSAPLTITAGDRFVSQFEGNVSGPGTCYINQGRLVVGF